MKKSRELELMMIAFDKAGVTVSGAMVNATADGLKSIRKERYEERVQAKKMYKDACQWRDRKKDGRKTRKNVTTDEGLAALRGSTSQKKLIAAVPAGKLAACVLTQEKLAKEATPLSRADEQRMEELLQEL